MTTPPTFVRNFFQPLREEIIDGKKYIIMYVEMCSSGIYYDEIWSKDIETDKWYLDSREIKESFYAS